MQKVLGNLEKGLLLVISAPAGTGKTTLTNMLVDEFPCVVQSISFTTREPREGEVPGVHYNYITKHEFAERIERGDFLEYAQIYGNFYGTSREWVEKQQNAGKHVMLVIDTQGATQVKAKTQAKLVFVKPPSFEDLRLRLTMRKTESSRMIEKRLEWAKHELEAEKHYDYLIINDDLDIAYQALRSILIAEEHRIV